MVTRIFTVGLVWALVGLAPIATAESATAPTREDDGAMVDCDLSESESSLFELLAHHREQRRQHLRCDAQLQAFARMRALDMARKGYFGHVTPDRIGPNALLEQFGYPLPSLYGGRLANNIEAIAAGLPTAMAVFDEFIDSRAHRVHLLGEIPFYAEQDEIGVAHVHEQGSDYEDYWVVVIARRARSGEPRYLCTPQPGPCLKMTNND